MTDDTSMGMAKSTYHVLDGDTLVYKPDESLSAWKSVYHVLVTRSTFRRDGDMIFVQDMKRLRDATLEDFEHFRVCPKGHIQ